MLPAFWKREKRVILARYTELRNSLLRNAESRLDIPFPKSGKHSHHAQELYELTHLYFAPNKNLMLKKISAVLTIDNIAEPSTRHPLFSETKHFNKGCEASAAIFIFFAGDGAT